MIAQPEHHSTVRALMLAGYYQRRRATLRTYQRLKMSNRTGRDADPRRTIPLQSAQWQRLRASILIDEPLCRHCMSRGIVTAGTDVDHISGDPSDNSRENLQVLCHSCHSIKTAADHGKRVMEGCDVNGMPDRWKKSLATDSARPTPQPSFIPKS